MSDPVYQSIFYKFNQLGPILQAGMNTHIRDDHLRMCMLQGVSSFVDGVYEHCTWKDELAEGQIRPEEFDLMLDHFIDAGEKFFKQGVKPFILDTATLVGGALQIVAGSAALLTPLGATPLDWILLWHGIDSTYEGLAGLLNLTTNTHLPSIGPAKYLDELVLGKKKGAVFFDIVDLGISFRGLMRLEIRTNEFGMPIRKLFRKDSKDYIRGFKNMTRKGLLNEMILDGFSTFDIYSQESEN